MGYANPTQNSLGRSTPKIVYRSTKNTKKPTIKISSCSLNVPQLYNYDIQSNKGMIQIKFCFSL